MSVCVCASGVDTREVNDTDEIVSRVGRQSSPFRASGPGGSSPTPIRLADVIASLLMERLSVQDEQRGTETSQKNTPTGSCLTLVKHLCCIKFLQAPELIAKL